jgi:hypothetical protein
MEVGGVSARRTIRGMDREVDGEGEKQKEAAECQPLTFTVCSVSAEKFAV